MLMFEFATSPPPFSAVEDQRGSAKLHRSGISTGWLVLLLCVAQGGCSPPQDTGDGHGPGQGGSAFFPEITPGGDSSEPGFKRDNPWLLGWGGAPAASLELPRKARETFSDEAAVSDSVVAPSTPSGELDGGDLSPEFTEPPWTWMFTDMREGVGSDKFLALRSVLASASVNGGDCELRQYSNGSTSPSRKIPLPEAAAAEAMSLCTTRSPEHPCDITLSGVLYNGNDALVIACGDVAVDRLGRVGEDPGDAWTDPSLQMSTQDMHLARCEAELSQGVSALDPQAPYFLEGWVPLQPEEAREAALMRCHPSHPAELGAAGAGNAP